MPNAQKRTFSLPVEHASFIDAKVASGDYASGSEVVRAALAALEERDAVVERWLKEQGGACSGRHAGRSFAGHSRREGIRRTSCAPCGRYEGRCLKKRWVVFAPEARDDLEALYLDISKAAGGRTALAYVERLEAYCLGFDLASSG